MRCFLLLVVIFLLTTPVLATEFHTLTKYPSYKDNTATQSARGELDCSNVIELQWYVTENHTTVGQPSNVDSYPCDMWDESGPEMVFHYTVEEQDPPWKITLDSYGVDLDLILIIDGSCDEADCDFILDGTFLTENPLPGDYYLIVDGYQGAAGEFSLLLSYSDDTPPPPVPLPNACSDFQQAFPGQSGDLVPNTQYSLSGNTCADGVNHIQNNTCLDWLSEGLDMYYEMVLLPGASIQAEVGFLYGQDTILYLMDGCGNQTSGGVPEFLVCADEGYDGSPETLAYTNSTEQEQLVYLVVDAYDEGTCGEFSGTILLTGNGAVSSEDTNWGSLKSLYR